MINGPTVVRKRQKMETAISDAMALLEVKDTSLEELKKKELALNWLMARARTAGG